MKITTAYSVLALAACVSLPLPADTCQFKVIYNFTGGTDGITPSASPIIGKGGVLYGTTFGDYFGPAEYGSAWSLTPPTIVGGTWTETTLFDFTRVDGNYPSGTLALGRNGVLYGTTTEGGISQSGGPGTLFSLTPPSLQGSAWTEQTLNVFDAAVGFGAASNVVFGIGGNLFGTTVRGPGTLYVAVHPEVSGQSWSVYPLHTFGGYAGDGYLPGEGLTIGMGGVIYGTTAEGGTGGQNGLGYAAGTVYSVTPPTEPGGLWAEQVLHSFSGVGDGTSPFSILAIDSKGVLYGTTARGPIGNANGCGGIFSLTPPAVTGSTWKFHNLYFFRGGVDGCGSIGGVVFGNDGNLYGTTSAGGDTNQGTLYSLTPPVDPGGKWTHTVLHSFSDPDGTGPETSLVLGAGGVLYGVAPSGGIGYGTVFAFKP